MKYIGNTQGTAGPRAGVILTNLGTPDAPTAGALRRYLKEFLSDPRIVELPRLLWWLVLHGVILVFRPRRSAANYRKVWTDQGSPLLVHTRNLVCGVEKALQEEFGGSVEVNMAMRYGSHSIENAIQAQLDKGIDTLVVLPLYPQYSCTTTGSTFDAVAADFSRRRCLPNLHFVRNYYRHPAYISALADTIERHWHQHGRADKLVFSYHGEPRRYVDNGDSYQRECEETTALLARALQLEESHYLTAYQSRFGREEWLRPYLDQTLKSAPERGIRSVQIVCPGFAVDCLETLDEIARENRELFLAAGGSRYEYIPALNSSEAHVDVLTAIIRRQLSSWPADQPAKE